MRKFCQKFRVKFIDWNSSVLSLSRLNFLFRDSVKFLSTFLVTTDSGFNKLQWLGTVWLANTFKRCNITLVFGCHSFCLIFSSSPRIRSNGLFNWSLILNQYALLLKQLSLFSCSHFSPMTFPCLFYLTVLFKHACLDGRKGLQYL